MELDVVDRTSCTRPLRYDSNQSSTVYEERAKWAVKQSWCASEEMPAKETDDFCWRATAVARCVDVIFVISFNVVRGRCWAQVRAELD